MPALSLDKEIKQYLPLLDSDEKQSLLSQIRMFLDRKNSSVTNESKTFKAEYNEELAAAEKRVAAGSFATLEDLEKESESW